MEMTTRPTSRICVYGIVQGVGFRPFISRLADRMGLKGSVANRGSYVEIFVNATEEEAENFASAIISEAPERSAILNLTRKPTAYMSYETFDIIESEHEAGDIFVSPDIATCKECRRELYDKSNRRYMHPFINCTACGPRLTILDSMPYDRVRTSMGEFPMCPECEWEYTTPETRRYDAQPVCCNDCGPEVYVLGTELRRHEAITYTRKAIAEGQIVAIKGIGGFHLCCDATNEAAVSRLRQLKRRPDKPFAVMMRDLETAEKYCEVSPLQEEILDGHQKPIILLRKKQNDPEEVKMPATLAPSVAPGNPKIGVMLPYAPVQMMIFDMDDGFTLPTDCLVMTSGNVSGAPICRTDEDALNEIAGFCDIILSHDRKIRLRADDSVMDFYKDAPYMIRRSRGYAPLPIMVDDSYHGSVLAVGGELKNTFAIAKNTLIYPSPYVGDMADLRTVKALSESIVRMEELLETEPTLVVCDMHPKYNTTLVAEDQGLPMLQVQHHYAHILSCMAENNYPRGEKVIGVSFDGTGYGTDGTIWGSEIMIADEYSFERVASIKPFRHVGGDVASKEGYRIAVSMLNDIYGAQAADLVAQLHLATEPERKLTATMAGRGINTIASTSAGRLFDAVSAILGICRASSFEGQASTSLQFAAEAYVPDADPVAKIHGLRNEQPQLWVHEENTEETDSRWFVLGTDQLVKYMTQEYLETGEANRLAYEFHLILAQMIVEAVLRISEQTGIKVCACSGGVFQNTLLLHLTERLLADADESMTVLRHSMIPPNDGGIALGQALAGMAYLGEKH